MQAVNIINHMTLFGDKSQRRGWNVPDVGTVLGLQQVGSGCLGGTPGMCMLRTSLCKIDAIFSVLTEFCLKWYSIKTKENLSKLVSQTTISKPLERKIKASSPSLLRKLSEHPFPFPV